MLMAILLVLAAVAPPVLQYVHSGLLLARGAPASRVRATGTAYSAALLLPAVVVLNSALPGQVDGDANVVLLAILAPTCVLDLGLLMASYLTDRRSRGAGWSISAYLHTLAPLHLLSAAALPPLLAGLAAGALVQRLAPSWPQHYIVLLSLLLSAVCAVLAWQWSLEDFRPVPPDLELRLITTGRRLGMRLQAIYVVPSQDRIANAYIQGLRPGHQRIVLTDYLVAQLSPEQVEAIFVHEVAHARLGHLQQRVWLQVGAALFTLAGLAAWIWLNLRILRWDAGLVALSSLVFVVVPRAWLRAAYRRQELAADRWAAGATGQPALLAGAMLAVEELNRSDTAHLPAWFKLIMEHPLTPARARALQALETNRLQ